MGHGRWAVQRASSAAPGENFGEMDGVPRGILPDLLPATESVCNQDRLCSRRTNRGQEHPLTQRLRDLILVLFEAKRACHAAAAGIQHSYPGLRGLQKGKLIL